MVYAGACALALAIAVAFSWLTPLNENYRVTVLDGVRPVRGAAIGGPDLSEGLAAAAPGRKAPMRPWSISILSVFSGSTV